MKLKHKLSELINQRDSYLEYSRCSEESLTMDSLLNLYAEITELNKQIKKLQEMPLKEGEKEFLSYSIEQPSKINQVIYASMEMVSPRKAKKTRKIKPMPEIPTTWNRTF